MRSSTTGRTAARRLTVVARRKSSGPRARMVGESAATLHGLLVAVAAISLAFSNPFSLTTLALFVLTVAAGWSGWLARSSMKKEVA